MYCMVFIQALKQVIGFAKYTWCSVIKAIMGQVHGTVLHFIEMPETFLEFNILHVNPPTHSYGSCLIKIYISICGSVWIHIHQNINTLV